MDGQQQRRALTAAEQAIRHLGAGNGTKAVDAARRAADLDQIGAFTGLAAPVATAADEVAASGTVTAATWDAIAVAIGPGPLAFLVEEVRSSPDGADA